MPPTRVPPEGAGPFRAVCFDLDGTLVETEILKARSYAEAAETLCPKDVRASDVIAAYGDLVGRPREEVVAALMRRFNLEEPAEEHMRELGAATPADALSKLRLRIFDRMLADPALIRAQAYPQAIALLRRVRAAGYLTGLATMSYAGQTHPVLEILGIADQFDAIVTRDEVTHPKPDPEIYHLLAERLGVPAAACVAVEDSVPGIESAQRAGMTVVASTSEMTRSRVHAAGLVPAARVVDDPARLAAVVDAVLAGAPVPR